MALMLSLEPLSSDTSSISSATRGTESSPASKISLSSATASSLDITSQSPSQASSSTSSAAARSWMMISGQGETFCISAGRSGRVLYPKSPSARDTARSPSTRFHCTNPPAESIRSRSRGFTGLWSKERGLAPPGTPMTQRESPALEQMMCLGVTMAVTEVQPLVSCPPVVPWYARMSTSICRKALMSARPSSSGSSSFVMYSCHSGVASMMPTIFSLAYLAAPAPAWPSHTPRKRWSGLEGMSTEM
mmetsp:Transcript_11825/g.25889  ORF Transcript_11825/g.25889 Transcript_11825/m.25889 type:complete len:247 (-) Transcript_11825:246-986(-)